MEKGFNREEFINWMKENYHIDRFSEDMINIIIDYAHKHEHVSKDMFCDFVSSMIPYIEKLYVARFCDDNILTDNTLRELGRI